MKRHTQQTLALAGVAQAAFLVHQLARHGMVSQGNLATCLNSLFVLDPKSTEEVYGKVSRLNLGLQVLQEVFSASNGFLKNPEVMRYIFGLLHLESRLKGKPRQLQAIREGLKAIEAAHAGPAKGDDMEVARKLGELYQATVSTLSFRIQVKGEAEFLKNELVAARIRATLLAGIRSAVLWRQLGGRRWQLLWQRRRISRDILMLLSNTQDYIG